MCALLRENLGTAVIRWEGSIAHRLTRQQTTDLVDFCNERLEGDMTSSSDETDATWTPVDIDTDDLYDSKEEEKEEEGI
jgi:hypothetical protein